MLEKFRDDIIKHKLCRKNEHILLAVSGGLDSMVMLDLFYKAGYNCTVLHCNFTLRGKESDEDENLVRKISEKYKLPFLSKHFETEKYARENNLSIQLAARELRYEWFHEQLDNLKGDHLATAHHLNDQLETVLLNLTKGTGIRGVSGIPVKTGNIIRPLLFATRQEIHTYAVENDIKWREDISNESTKYQRNFIRHELVPLMEKINPSLLDTFSRTSKRLKEGSQIIHEVVEVFQKEHLKQSASDHSINIEVIKDKNPTFLQLLLEPFDINYSQAESIAEGLASGKTGILIYTNNFCLNLDREVLLISKTEPTFELKKIKEIDNHVDGLFKIQQVNKDEFRIDNNKEVGQLDFEKLTFPLIVRTWQEGDRFVPLGMKGQKKLSDFMIDNKIAVNLKNRVLVLVSGGDIVWVVGHRIDDRYKVTENTKIIYKIEWLHEKSI